MDFICASLDLFAAAIIGVLLLGAFFKRDHPKPFGKKMIWLLVGHMIGLLCDSILWFWHPEMFPTISIATMVTVQKILLLIAYIVLAGMTIVYTGCLVKYIEEKALVSKYIVPVVTAVCIVAVLLWTISIFNGIFFFFDDRGMFIATDLYCVTQGIIGLMLCVDIFLILKHRRSMGWWNAISLLSYVLLPVIGFFFSFWWDVTPVYLAATLSMLLMFIVFHLEQDKQLREQEQQLAQSRIAIMLTQIKPHFIYNTLTAICGLCDENPKKAKQVASEFADYLRHNLESLTQNTTVPFVDELQHTKVYLGIEQDRFENRLKIVYDIADIEFRIPPLTMQPIVDNSVKHGITKKKGGGTVTISTREQDDSYEVLISDNGVGFDTEKPLIDDEMHIGIQNVRDRLWAMCRGTLTIISEIGVGTTAAIKLPKGNQKGSVKKTVLMPSREKTLPCRGRKRIAGGEFAPSCGCVQSSEA